MPQIVRWLPVVKRLVAVEDGREEGRQQIGQQKTVEHRNGPQLKQRRRRLRP
jgi:hypothetical protein